MNTALHLFDPGTREALFAAALVLAIVGAAFLAWTIE